MKKDLEASIIGIWFDRLTMDVMAILSIRFGSYQQMSTELNLSKMMREKWAETHKPKPIINVRKKVSKS